MINHHTPLQIGWIGTGVMGLSMCGHLMSAGHSVHVYSRSKHKAKPLLEQGAVWSATPQLLANECDIVFTMVGLPEDVREVYLGEFGILQAEDLPGIVVDMTTSEPSLAQDIFQQAKALGVQAIDAPVSGGDIGAKAGMLSIMVGGDALAIAEVYPLFELMAKTIIHQGAAGAGQHTKMCNQIMAAGSMIGMCESLLYGYKAGLKLEVMLESIGGGAAACWALENLAPRVLDSDFSPGFFVTHFVKDMGIVLDEAKRMSLVLPGLSLVHQLYLAVQAQGHGKLGTQALMLALQQLSGVNHFKSSNH
ncbi:MAG: NAD(P)-dependent oxidoreductase [Methylococcales bacterium]|jgi:3-hydroxyisobutyrate dehydrogenase|nr:NAD(P)-dependent oxidoreductase [Methylococcales bacterium]MBT7445098.1 NAD(P)-dependent oxidoreductase [Methylococcales bacterium]